MNSGTVNVTTAVKDGMNVDDFLMYGGTVNVTNPNGDGIDGDQGVVEIYGGTVNVTVTADGSKGLKSGGDMTFVGGETTVH